MSLKPKTQYRDSEGFVHNYAPKSDEEKVFPETKKEMTLEESEAYYKMQLEKMMSQFKKTNKMIEDINNNLRTLIETDKQVHNDPEPEPTPESAPEEGDGKDSKDELKDKIEDQK